MSLINAFFIGSPRCMTTKIISDLRDHPQVGCSSPKELKYFNLYYGNQQYLESSYAKKSTAKVRVYSNPNDCTMDFVRDRIYDYNPHATMIMIVRNPIERAISHWGILSTLSIGRVKDMWSEFDANYNNFSLNKFRSESDFVPYTNQWASNYVQHYFECGMYYRNYKRYEQFEDLYILDFEELQRDYQTEFDYICGLLGVDDIIVDDHRIHSLAQRGSNLVISNHVEEFKRRYPEIVHMFAIEAIALSRITGVNYALKWGLI